jgi:hypothetical protein
MGSVPRINCLLAIVPLFNKGYSLQVKFTYRKAELFCQYDKLNKGVSIISHQLPYTLKFVQSYPITSNSKAA